MTQITIDHRLAEQLLQSSSDVELCSPDGEILGRFRSEAIRRLYAEAQCPVSEEELTRRRREETGRTLDDIIADLEPRD